ncbi:hypothetical protein, partial [Campylobacter jejuni]
FQKNEKLEHSEQKLVNLLISE